MSDHEPDLRALVVGGVDYGDADRVVHLLTDRGRLAAFAHGARKSKRRFAGALELFATIRVSFEPRRGKSGMPTLSSAIVEAPRLHLRADLGKIAVASYAVELAAAVAPENEASEPQHALTEALLDHLADHEASCALRRTFELKLVDLLGYRPFLDACTVCGAEARPSYLDLAGGGVHCADHRGAAPEVGPRTLEWIRAVLDTPDLDAEAGLGAEHAARAAKALARPMTTFFAGLLGRPLKSLAMAEGLGL
ncbi:DNA repair protein RecO [Myxococcota bacterium]|nr:DNA repair protein RecO [Myxococcota bacterium]